MNSYVLQCFGHTSVPELTTQFTQPSDTLARTYAEKVIPYIAHRNIFRFYLWKIAPVQEMVGSWQTVETVQVTDITEREQRHVHNRPPADTSGR